MLQKDDKDAIVSIKDCSFNIGKNSDCSFFFVRGIRGSLCELKDCTFTGDLTNGAHYINGLSISIDSPKLQVKSCKFSIINDAIIMKTKSSFVIFVDLDKEAKYMIKFNTSLTTVLTLMIVAFVVFFVIKKSNRNNDDEENIEMQTIYLL